MALFGDIAGDDEAAVAQVTSEVVRIANRRVGEGFIAVSAAARHKFWLDRAKTAAIAKHTNAFKINEDVVIPLERLGEYTDAIERINIELSIRNKLELVDGLERHFSDAAAANGLADRRNEALELLGKVRSRWRYLLDSMDGAAPQGLSGSVFERLQDRSIRVSWKTELRAELEHLFVGESRAPMLAECDALHREVLKGRVFVALHMHAGDGNVHTNIPVNSDNYAMLQTANQAVARIMQIARALNGVISGEHGIGITKLEHFASTRRA